MIGDMTTGVVRIEKIASNAIEPEIERMGKIYGGLLTKEILLSAMALLTAKAIASVHVWTGQSIDLIRAGFDEALDQNIKMTMKKMKNRE
jgi:hypothetical protein